MDDKKSDKVAKLLVSYLWRVIRLTDKNEKTVDGRAPLGEKETYMERQFGDLCNILQKCRELCDDHCSNVVGFDRFVHNQWYENMGPQNGPESFHEWMLKELDDCNAERRAWSRISQSFKEAFKKRLYAHVFEDEGAGFDVGSSDDLDLGSPDGARRLQDLVYEDLRANLDDDDNRRIGDIKTSSGVHDKIKNKMSLKDEEIRCEWPVFCGENIMWLITQRYKNGYPVFKRDMLPGRLTDKFREKNIGPCKGLPELLENMSNEVGDGYSRYCDSLKQLKVYDSRSILRKDTVERRLENIKRDIAKEKEDLLHSQVVNISDLDDEADFFKKKAEIAEQKAKHSADLEALEMEYHKLSIIYGHVCEGKRIDEVVGENALKKRLGFYVTRTMETEEQFDSILESAGLGAVKHNRTLLRSLDSANMLEIDRIVKVPMHEESGGFFDVYVEISDPQHFSGSQFIQFRDRNKICSIVAQGMFPFLYFSFDCLPVLECMCQGEVAGESGEAVSCRFLNLVQDLAQESRNMSSIIELHNGKTIRNCLANGDDLDRSQFISRHIEEYSGSRTGER